MKRTRVAAAASTAATDLTICPICLEMCNIPKSLPCLHAFCHACLQVLFGNKSPGDKESCPKCREEFHIPVGGVDGLRHHFIVQQLVEQELERKRLRKSSCAKHDEQVKLFCHDCEMSICVVCFAVDHKCHDTLDLSEVAGYFVLRMEDDDAQILSSISSIREQSEQMQLDTTTFHSNVEDIKKQVRATGHFAKHLVDCQINDMLMKLESVASENAKQSESAQKTHQQALASMETFHADSRELLDHGEPSEITQAACALHVRATQLSDVTVVRYHPRDVTYTPADVTQVKRLNLVGELTVTDKQLETSVYLPKSIETEQVRDTAAVLQDELIQAADREIQLQSQLDEVKGDISQLQKWLEQRPSLQKEFSDFKQHTAPQLEQEMKQRDMGHVIRKLTKGEPLCGVTSLNNRLHVLRENKSSQQIEVCDIDTFSFLGYLTVSGLEEGAYDLVACAHNSCTYVSNQSHASIHRLTHTDLLSDTVVTEWPVNDMPAGLSVTNRHHLLVSCYRVRKVKKFSTHGQLLHVLTLPESVVNPWLSVQLSNGQSIVCHGGYFVDQVHGVSLIDSDNKVVKTFGGAKGSGSQQVNWPAHMAVDGNEFVFVVDVNNCRVVLLSPLLTYVRDVVIHEQRQWKPVRVHVDPNRRQLYVAVNQWKHGSKDTGQVIVVSL